MKNDILSHADEILINVYSFWPVQFVRGEGCYLFDADGKRYLDFAAGIAVTNLGYAHPAYTKALKDQIDALHLSLCYTPDPVRMKAAERMVALSGLDQIFFCSTGAEAIEGCLKTARKWASETKGADCHEFIYVQNSFHGRTMGALSVNGQEAYRKGFEPLLSGTHQAQFNDLDSVRRLISPRTAAVIVEPVLGEGGIIPGTPEFIKGLRALCDQHNVALIFDEVQCGMGRIGTLFAFEHYGVTPDLAAWAKGLGAGFPVGAFMGKKTFTSHITHGSHGSTYGGNPLACAAVNAVLDELTRPDFLKNVAETGKILQDGLTEIARHTNKISNVRGIGMMLAADYHDGKVKDFCKTCLKHGLVVLSCGENSLRIVPPLVLSPEDARVGLEILEDALKH
jgi:acetylornithine/N-succinyldiaminopimelate aminotransferase